MVSSSSMALRTNTGTSLVAGWSAEPRDDTETVEGARQHQIEEHDVEMLGEGPLDGVFAVRHPDHLVTARVHQRLDHVADGVLVFDEQNPHRSGA